MVRTAPQVLVRVEVKGHHDDDDVCVMFACMAGTCLHFAMVGSGKSSSITPDARSPTRSTEKSQPRNGWKNMDVLHE